MVDKTQSVWGSIPSDGLVYECRASSLHVGSICSARMGTQ